MGVSKHCKAVSFKSVFVPILIHGHESWVMTERILSQVQSAQMGFLLRVRAVSLCDKVAAVKYRKVLNAESLLGIERSQLGSSM